MTFSMGNTKAGKLTPVLVIEIREKYATRLYTQARLSREYHVSINTIRNVVGGVTWQDVAMIEPQDVIDEAALRSQRKLDAMMAGATTTELSEDVMAAMQNAVAAIPEMPQQRNAISAELAARMAAYGVRPSPTGTQRDEAAPALGADDRAAEVGADD